MNDDYPNVEVLVGKINAFHSYPSPSGIKDSLGKDYFFSLLVDSELKLHCYHFDVDDSIERVLEEAGNSLGEKLKSIGIPKYSMVNGRKAWNPEENAACEPLSDRHIDRLKEIIDSAMAKNS